jgi:hypothetical protein
MLLQPHPFLWTAIENTRMIRFFPPPRFRAPADVAVAAAEMARRRTPCQTRNRSGTQWAPPPTPHTSDAHRRAVHIPNSDLLDKTVEQRLFRRPPDLS